MSVPTAKPRRTLHMSVARELDVIDFEARQETFNYACDFLEANGFAEAAKALEGHVFEAGNDAGAPAGEEGRP